MVYGELGTLGDRRHIRYYYFKHQYQYHSLHIITWVVDFRLVLLQLYFSDLTAYRLHLLIPKLSAQRLANCRLPSCHPDLVADKRPRGAAPLQFKNATTVTQTS